MFSKRSAITLLSAAVIGAGLGSTDRIFASEFIPPDDGGDSSGYTGHSHQEPDGGWFCHCGDNPDCKPCGGSEAT